MKAIPTVVVKEWDREGIIWAAGLFEGEGSVYKKSLPREDWTYPIMYLGSTDEDVVVRFYKSIGELGRLYSRSGSEAHYKRVYIWELNGFEGVQCLSAMFWPWLGTRRRAKISEVLVNSSSMSIEMRCREVVCSVEGCSKLAEGRQTLCKTHKSREFRNQNRVWYNIYAMFLRLKKRYPEMADEIDCTTKYLATEYWRIKNGHR